MFITDIFVWLVAIFLIGKIIFYPRGAKRLNNKKEQKALDAGYTNRRDGAKVLDDKPRPYDPIMYRNIEGVSVDNSVIKSESQNRIREFAKGLGMATIAPGMIVGEIAGKSIGNVVGKGAKAIDDKVTPHLRKITGPVLALGEKTFKAAKFYKTLAVEKGKHYTTQLKDKAVEIVPEETRRKIKFYTTLGVEKGKHYAIQAGRIIKSTQGYRTGKRGLITMKGAITADPYYFTRSFSTTKGTAIRLKQANDVRDVASMNQNIKNVDNLDRKLENSQNELAQVRKKIEEAKRIPNNDLQTHLLELEEEKAKIETENIIKQLKEREGKNAEHRFNGPDYSKQSEIKNNLENEKNEILKQLETEKDENIRQEMESDIRRIDEELKRIREEEQTQSKEEVDVSVNKLTVNMNPKVEILKAGKKEARRSGLTSKQAVMYSNLKKQMIEQELKAADNKTAFNREEVQEYLVPAVQETAKANGSKKVTSKEVYRTVEKAVEQKHSEENMVRVAARMHADEKVDFDKEIRKTLDDILSSDKAKEQLAEKIMNLDKVKDKLYITDETEERVSKLETFVKKAGIDIKKLKQDGIFENGEIKEDKIEEITPLIKEEILKDPKSQLAREFLGEEGFKELSATLEKNVQNYNTTVQKYIDNYERTQDEMFLDRNIDTHPEYAELSSRELREERVLDDRKRHIRNAMDETNKEFERLTNDNPIVNTKESEDYNPIKRRNGFSVVRTQRNGNQSRYKDYSLKSDRGITGEAG